MIGNHFDNGIALTAAEHRTNWNAHPLYNGYITDKLDEIMTLHPNITPNDAIKEVHTILDEIRQWIALNPGKHIDEIVN